MNGHSQSTVQKSFFFFLSLYITFSPFSAEFWLCYESWLICFNIILLCLVLCYYSLCCFRRLDNFAQIVPKKWKFPFPSLILGQVGTVSVIFPSQFHCSFGWIRCLDTWTTDARRCYWNLPLSLNEVTAALKILPPWTVWTTCTILIQICYTFSSSFSANLSYSSQRTSLPYKQHIGPGKI